MQAVVNGTAIYNTDLAASFKLLTTTQIANLAVTQGLEEEQLKAALAASTLSKQQRQEVIAAYEAATAKGTDAAATNTLTFSMGNLTTAIWANIKAFGTWLLTTPAGWITTAVAAIAIGVTIYKKYNAVIQESIEKAQELQDAYKQASDEISDNISAVKDLTDEFNTLSKGVGNHGENISLSADEYERYLEIVKQLVDITPSLVKGYDDEGNAIIDKNNALQETINLLKEQQSLELTQATSADNNWDIAKGLKNAYKQELDELEEAQSQLVEKLEYAVFNQDTEGNLKLSVDTNDVEQTFAELGELFDVNLAGIGTGASLNEWVSLFDAIQNSSADAGQIIKDNFEYINSLLDQNSVEAGAFRQALTDWQTAQKAADKAATAYQSHMKIIAQASAGYNALGNSSKDFLNTWIESQKLTDDMSKSDVEAITTNIQNMVRLLADGVEIDGNLIDLDLELDKLFAVDWDSLGGEWYNAALAEAEAVIAHLVQALNLTDEQVIDLKLALGLTLVSPETGQPIDAHTYYSSLLSSKLAGSIFHDVSDIRALSTEELKVGLSLEPSDYSGWDAFYQAVQEAMSSVEDLTGTVAEFKDQIDAVASYEEAYEDLSKALGEFIENGNISADTVTGLIETFGETDALKNLIALLGQEGVTAAQVQEALDSLGEEHLACSEILNNLTEETAGWAVTALEANGVANAQEVVMNRLAAQQLEVQYATELASLATWDEVSAFLQEQGASEQVIASLSALRTEQLKAKVAATDFTTASQSVTAALLAQAKAAGVSAQAISILSSIQSMQTLKAKYTDPASVSYYDSLITSLQDRLNGIIASAESPLDFKVNVTPTFSSSSSSKEVEAYTAEIDKFRESLERLDRIQREQERVELHLSNTDDLEQQIDYHNQLISIYRDEQAAMHDLNEERDAYIQSGVDKLRGAGFKVEYDADNNNFFVENLEHLNELVAASQGEYDSMQEATNAYIKEMEDLIDELTSLNEANMETSESWWDLQYSIREAKVNIVNNLQDIVTAASDSVDEIQNVYSVLQDAADEYAANGGFISIDAYQKIVELGPEYMQYLLDENGLLIINEEAINRVIAAKTEQLALENAMSYVERLRLALQEDSVEDLNQLLYATTEATDATWGLVYANLALLDLNDDQYQAALHNIQAIRSLAATAVAGIGQTAGGFADELENMKSGMDDILDYVMDMLQDQVEQQIDSLENLKDSYAEIIAQRKEMLELAQREKEYQDEVNDKTAELAKLESRRAALEGAVKSGDRNAALELGSVTEQIKELQDDLNDYQYDHYVETTEDALDQELSDYEAQQDEKIKILEDSISSTQKIYSMAIDYIEANWSTLYDELIAWNTQYGSALNDEITSAWDNCIAAAQRYGTSVSAIMSGLDTDIASASGAGGSVGGGSGSNGNNTIVGATKYNAASTREETIHAIIKEMYQNSQLWHTANASEQDRLSQRNLQLGALLPAYGVDAKRDPNTGVWYVGNEQLFEKYRDYCFHNGGIVGGDAVATPKQNEMFALLKKKEMVITEAQQNNLWNILSSLSPVNALKEALSSLKSGSLAPALAGGAAPYVDASININGSMPEDQIMTVLKKQQRTVANLVSRNLK